MHDRIRQKGRLIYLLALFQLAGGPLVIGGVLLAGKMWRMCAPVETGALAAREETTTGDDLGGIDADVLGRLLLEMSAKAPDDPRKPAPAPRTKDVKGKLWTINDLGGHVRLAAPPPLIARLPMESEWLEVRSHPPPAPPPRAA